MDLGTDRLEAASRTQERPRSQLTEEPNRRGVRRSRNQKKSDEAEMAAEEQESHQVDDLV